MFILKPVLAILLLLLLLLLYSYTSATKIVALLIVSRSIYYIVLFIYTNHHTAILLEYDTRVEERSTFFILDLKFYPTPHSKNKKYIYKK